MIVFAEKVKINSTGKISVRDGTPELAQIVLVTILTPHKLLLFSSNYLN